MANLTFLRAKIHRARVTGADLNYEGSISLCPRLREKSGLYLLEKVEIYNINNGQRFETYVIEGKVGEVVLNGAAARLVAPGDLLIICSYVQLTPLELAQHECRVLIVNENNEVIQHLIQRPIS